MEVLKSIYKQKQAKKNGLEINGDVTAILKYLKAVTFEGNQTCTMLSRTRINMRRRQNTDLGACSQEIGVLQLFINCVMLEI